MEDRDADVAAGVYCISPHEIFSRDLFVGEEREREREKERERKREREREREIERERERERDGSYH